MKRMFQPHYLAVKCGMSLEKVTAKLDQYRESWKYLLYHDCEDVAVAILDNKELPEFCPDCECELFEEDVSWDVCKFLESDRKGLPEGWNA